MSCLRGDKPNMPFNQQMSFPCEISLRVTPEWIRLFAEPVRELETLHARELDVLPAGKMPDLGAECLEIRMSLNTAMATPDGSEIMNIHGLPLVYDQDARSLRLGDKAAPCPDSGEELHLQIRVDRSSVEAFAERGALTLSAATVPDNGAPTVVFGPRTGGYPVKKCEVFELESIWSGNL